MSNIRLSNFKHITGVPYRLLEEHEGVSYEEHFIGENARRLLEGELDVALISAAEFANCGDYVGLDFGIGCKGPSHRLILYSRHPLHTIHTIHVYEDSGAAILLLKLLLTDKWHISPRIVRGQMPCEPHQAGDNEAVLILHDRPVDLSKRRYAVQEDLTGVWRQHTGYPFVFLIWASRQKALNFEQHKFLQESLFKCHQARTLEPENLLRQLTRTPEQLEIYTPDTAFDYYLDEELIEGLNYFYNLAAKRGLLPFSRYRSATYSLLGPKKVRTRKSAPVDHVLQDVVNGQRLSIAGAMRLADKAGLADLGLAADLIRRRMFSRRAVNYSACFNEEELAGKNDIHSLLTEEWVPEVSDVTILPSEDGTVLSLSESVTILQKLKELDITTIEGYGVPNLLRIAAGESLPFPTVVARLAEAGLNQVPAWGGGMLLDGRDCDSFTAEQWLKGMQEVHFQGLRSASAMLVSPGDSWQQRLIHLHKLRTLQDHTSGFSAFSILLSREWEKNPDTEAQLRAIIVARLFLDNIPSFQELDITRTGVRGLLNLSFGSNAIRILIDRDNQEAVSDALHMLQILTEKGMDFNRTSFDTVSTRFLSS